MTDVYLKDKKITWGLVYRYRVDLHVISFLEIKLSKVILIMILDQMVVHNEIFCNIL